MIHRDALPCGIQTKKLSDAQRLKTLAGNFDTSEMVKLRDRRLPEFDKNRRIDEQRALVFDTKCRYDIILGTDFLKKAGIRMNYDTGFMEWFECILPMCDPWGLMSEEFDNMVDSLLIQQKTNCLEKIGSITMQQKFLMLSTILPAYETL